MPEGTLKQYWPKVSLIACFLLREAQREIAAREDAPEHEAAEQDSSLSAGSDARLINAGKYLSFLSQRDAKVEAEKDRRARQARGQQQPSQVDAGEPLHGSASIVYASRCLLMCMAFRKFHWLASFQKPVAVLILMPSTASPYHASFQSRAQGFQRLPLACSCSECRSTNSLAKHNLTSCLQVA